MDSFESNSTLPPKLIEMTSKCDGFQILWHLQQLQCADLRLSWNNSSDRKMV